MEQMPWWVQRPSIWDPQSAVPFAAGNLSGKFLWTLGGMKSDDHGLNSSATT